MQRDTDPAGQNQAGTPDPADAQALLAIGVEHHRAGRLQAAEAAYSDVLRIEPTNADGLHLLGVIANQSNDNQRALEFISRALAINPNVAIYRNNMAVALRASGRTDEAIVHYRQAVEMDPGYAEAHNNLANALDDLGQTDDAIQSYEQAITLESDYVDAHTGLGIVLMKRGERERAATHFQRATELAPDSAMAQKNIGNLLVQEGDLEGAIAALRRATDLDRDYVPAFRDLGGLLSDANRPEEAETLLLRAVELDPNDLKTRNNLGHVLQDLERLDDAAEQFRTIVELDPDNAQAYNDLAVVSNALGQFDVALTALDQAIDRIPDYDEAMNNRSLIRLARADFDGGWRDGLVRPTIRNEIGRISRAPVPADLAGKHVRLSAEQGPGAEIFFLRFAPELKARGAHITFDPDPNIASLVARLPFIEKNLGPGDEPGHADIRYAIGDLPYVFGMANVADIPPSIELSALPEHVRDMTARLKNLGPPPYIGLTWQAGVTRGNHSSKVAPIDIFANVVAPVSATVIALQRLPGDDEIRTMTELLGRPVHDLTALNNDLEAMLAILELLDDYLCVSNTNTHLREALGKPSRVLVPMPPEYRWMTEGETSPWFPNCRVYRQSNNGDWDDAMAQLKGDLGAAFPAT